MQIVDEFQVANFETSEVGFEVNYAEPIRDLAFQRLSGVFVTLVYAETRCETARPWLLLSLFLGFLALGLIMNAPFFFFVPSHGAAESRRSLRAKVHQNCETNR